MKLEIVSKKNNPLLKREDIEIELEHGKAATPSRSEILPEIANLLKSDQKHIIIDKIFTQSGITTARVLAELYKKPEDIPAGKMQKSSQRIKVKAEAKEEVKPEGKKEGE